MPTAFGLLKQRAESMLIAQQLTSRPINIRHCIIACKHLAFGKIILLSIHGYISLLNDVSQKSPVRTF